MQTVRTLMKNKNSEVISVTPDTSVYDALKLMSEKSIGAVLVLDNGELKGILSERDYARKVVLQGRSSKETLVQDIMTEKVLFVENTVHVEECMALMNAKKVRHLPVFENGKLVGVISIGDVLKAILNQKDFVINQLEQYITGNR